MSSAQHGSNTAEPSLVQQDVWVAYQGVPGAYSFEAANAHFGSEACLLSCPTFTDVCEAVTTDHAAYGVLPVFNSQTGYIDEMERIIKKYALRVVDAINYPIKHCLLCLPGQQLHDIVTVISHPQALAQCSKFLANLPVVRQTPTSNTAASAQMIQEKKLKEFAAIAGASAAKFYELTILVSNIQNTLNNTTRFSIVAKG